MFVCHPKHCASRAGSSRTMESLKHSVDDHYYVLFRRLFGACMAFHMLVLDSPISKVATRHAARALARERLSPFPSEKFALARVRKWIYRHELLL
jgi:hypothetical protein